jgi:hypothetical protein
MRYDRELPWKRKIIALLLFGTAFGYLEAAVVSYLRLLHEPARQRFYPGRPPGDLFPLLTLEQLRASGPEQRQTLAVELGREAATIIMLAAVALAVAENAGQWAAAFVIAFGSWDITFYVFLKVLLGWPASLFTWDILFLIPVPWIAPVLAPVVVSAALVAALYFERRRAWSGRASARHRGRNHRRRHSSRRISFAMDYRNVWPKDAEPVHWGIFGLGLLTGIAGYAATSPAADSRAIDRGSARVTWQSGLRAAARRAVFLLVLRYPNRLGEAVREVLQVS